ncbi:MAG: hypothetical protein Satyrvirus15_11 [Satyrvirus sp.]|uniref:Uncharacterized protein n=1 Tax=Satyrvirus sp. TaxID=2487771 RepID=A0A3G5AFP8_9VIRU|nr:MAG: hypothetical protein Satyrvirus15_11 [Satyrvirus sp.]
MNKFHNPQYVVNIITENFAQKNEYFILIPIQKKPRGTATNFLFRLTQKFL